jgi:hypothetical protein
VASGFEAGVVSMDRARGRFAACKITANLSQGVDVRSSQVLVFEQCHFLRNSFNGVRAGPGGRGKVSECVFKDNGEGSLKLDPASHIEQTGNAVN